MKVSPPKDGPAEQYVAPAGKPGFTARVGEQYEVDDEVGKSLQAQGWTTDTKAPRAKTEKE